MESVDVFARHKKKDKAILREVDFVARNTIFIKNVNELRLINTYSKF